MITKNVPYEFLARWNYQTGALAGAHIKFYSATFDDSGVLIAGQEGATIPVSLAGYNGFPLADILPEIVAAAIVAKETAVAELVAASNALAQEKKDHQAALAALDKAPLSDGHRQRLLP